MKAQRIFLLPLFLSACDGGSKDPPLVDAAIDIDAPNVDAAPPPNVIAVDTFGETPVFIRYRNGTGPWLEPTKTTDGYEFRIDAQYELVAVCGDATNGFDVGSEAGTWEEIGGETFLPCFGTFAAETTHALTGTMVQAGNVSTGSAFDESATGNWAFTLDTTEGANDLLATGGGRMLLRRNIAVPAPTTTGAINLVQDGAATTTMPLTINNLVAGDVTRARTYLITSRAFFNLADETGPTGRVAPASQLIASDAQFLSLSISGGNYRRSAFKRHTTASPASTFTLMPRLEGVTLTNGTAAWTALPAGTAEISVFSGISYFHRSATEGWLTGKTSLAIDTDIPGFMPDWKPGTIEFAQFEVASSQGGASYRSGIVAQPPSLKSLSRLERVRMADVRRMRR